MSEDQAKLFATTFSSPAGKEVLQHLRSITIEMVNGPAFDPNSLIHMEGQRFIVGYIEQLIAQGHRSKSDGTADKPSKRRGRTSSGS